MLPIVTRFGRRILHWKILAPAVLALVLIVVSAVAVKGLDRQVLSEASKSLGYRIEYWRATLSMIGAYPWLGVGPGNFQDYYTRFKLPEASEEVRDPHNILLELWATAGTFAFVLFVAALEISPGDRCGRRPRAMKPIPCPRRSQQVTNRLAQPASSS